MQTYSTAGAGARNGVAARGLDLDGVREALDVANVVRLGGEEGARIWVPRRR
jgi:hypothetical protein